jgi:hypothetical protein
VNTDRSYLADSVDAAVGRALLRADVSGIVLVHLGDGGDSFLGQGTERIPAGHFSFWARRCAFSGRSFLVLLGGACSTLFAQGVWRAITRHVWREEMQAVLDYVGFITSSRTVYACSTPIVSRDPAVVDCFDECSDSLPGGLVPGFYVRGSIFCCQLNRWLAYGFGCSAATSVFEFVGLLNPRRAEPQGFRAEYVGAHAVGCLPLSAFFPLGRQQPTTNIGGLSGLKLADLVAPEELGELSDDPHFNWATPWDERWFLGQLIEVGRDGFAPGQPQERINIHEIAGHPLLDLLPGNSSAKKTVCPSA